MLCYIDNIIKVSLMSIGRSGRIVIEVDTGTKRELYSALNKEGLTLKEWFLKSAISYISNGSQISLPLLPSATGADEPKTSGGPKRAL